MNRIKELEEKILEARNAYYNHQAIYTDQVYDAWIDELKQLDPANKAVVSVGAPAQPSEWKKATHQIPMGSLDKVNTPEELVKWINNINITNLFVTEKLDGLSIELVYEAGSLVQAITRGDGIVGEDITVNVRKMQGVPASLKDNFTGSLRGEIVMRKSIHKQYFSDKANPRNAASGISKRLDGVGAEHLEVILYQALGDVDFKTETEQFRWLSQQGCHIPAYTSALTKPEYVVEIWKKYQAQTRGVLDYDIDGLVIRVEDLSLQLSLGDKDMRPKGAVAFKFDSEARESIIRNIDWQVGNSGRLTPVATLDPVTLVGATITRASLYNARYIEELGLDIGATVLVVRANDVIPRVEQLIKGTGSTAQVPKSCPECNGSVLLDGENAVCTNTSSCPAQRIGRIKNWIKELNLLEWGDTLVEKLVQSGKVKDIPDLYKLTVDDLASLDRMGKKSAQKCHDILWQNNEVPLDIFLGALSIPMIGSSSIRQIMSFGCDTLEKFGQLKAENFEQVPGIGPIKAKALASGLVSNRDCILELIAQGVKIKSKIVGTLTGKSICFTGTMKNKRPVLEKMASEAGAEIKSSVGKGLSYLVIADINSTSSKAIAARKFGTVLISEEEFLEKVQI